MSEPLTYSQLYGEMRALYLGRRHWIEICAQGKGYAARDESWHIEQRARLASIQQAGELLKLISTHEDSFRAWLETLPKSETAA